MDNKLEVALADLITKSMEGIDKAQGFLMAELPEVVEQLLMWHMIHSLSISVLSIIALLSFLFLVVKFVKAVPDKPEKRAKGGESNWYWEVKEYGVYIREFIVVGYIVALFVFLPIAIISINSINLTWLKIWIAPKVWLIEYAATLVK